MPAWLTEFAIHRTFLYNTLKTARCKCSGHGQKKRPQAYHSPYCTLGQLLLAVGGEPEAAYQRDLGHQLAFGEGSEYWKRYWTQEMSDAVAQLRQGEFRDGPRVAYDPVMFSPRVLTMLRHAGILENERHTGWIRIPRHVNACGQCTAVGPMPHYPGCQG